jgi:hypothetical protein
VESRPSSPLSPSPSERKQAQPVEERERRGLFEPVLSACLVLNPRSQPLPSVLLKLGLNSLVSVFASSSSCQVTVYIKNKGPEAYQPEKYGSEIIVERNLSREGQGGYKIKSSKTKPYKTVSTKREELDRILDHLNIQVSLSAKKRFGPDEKRADDALASRDDRSTTQSTSSRKMLLELSSPSPTTRPNMRFVSLAISSSPILYPCNPS